MLRSVLRFVFVTVAVFSLTACGTLVIRGGTPSQDYSRYSMFFTPTHSFECSNTAGLGSATFQFVPEDVYAAHDFGGFRYNVFNKWRVSWGDLPKDAIGLHIHRTMYAIILPNGEFAVPNYPLAWDVAKIDSLEAVAFNDIVKFQCRNDPGRPPFEQIDVNRLKK